MSFVPLFFLRNFFNFRLSNFFDEERAARSNRRGDIVYGACLPLLCDVPQCFLLLFLFVVFFQRSKKNTTKIRRFKILKERFGQNQQLFEFSGQREFVAQLGGLPLGGR